MKRLLLVILLLVLVGCAPPSGTVGITVPTDTQSTDGAQFVITIISTMPYIYRIIDTELHIVCYATYSDGGIYCLPTQ